MATPYGSASGRGQHDPPEHLPGLHLPVRQYRLLQRQHLVHDRGQLPFARRGEHAAIAARRSAQGMVSALNVANDSDFRNAVISSLPKSAGGSPATTPTATMR